MPQALSLELIDGATLDIVADQVPAFAAGLRARGAATVCVLDVVQPGGTRLHWLESEHARGWLKPASAHVPPASPQRSQHFREVFDDARRQGFVGADAALLAAMAADTALDTAPVLPRLSWGELPRFAHASLLQGIPPLGLYALVESAERLRPVLASGVYTVQMRIKTPAQPDAAWRERLRAEVAQGIEIAHMAKAELFINDHWALAGELGAHGVHLGQEDLQALGEDGRAKLLASGLCLGISSHSLWELCRARSLAPRYIACGPVWPTTTKDMPWVPQGLDNLAWWCRMAGAPVVAIGGILQAEQVRATAACGADGVCIVRGLGDAPEQVVPGLREAFRTGHAMPRTAAPHWPHPTLPEQST